MADLGGYAVSRHDLAYEASPPSGGQQHGPGSIRGHVSTRARARASAGIPALATPFRQNVEEGA